MTFIDWIRSHPCEVVGFSLLITLCLAIVASVVMSFLRDKCDEMLSHGWSSPEEVEEIGRAYRKDLVARLRMTIEHFEEEAAKSLLRGDNRAWTMNLARVGVVLKVIEMVEGDGK